MNQNTSGLSLSLLQVSVSKNTPVDSPCTSVHCTIAADVSALIIVIIYYGCFFVPSFIALFNVLFDQYCPRRVYSRFSPLFVNYFRFVMSYWYCILLVLSYPEVPFPFGRCLYDFVMYFINIFIADAPIRVTLTSGFETQEEEDSVADESPDFSHVYDSYCNDCRSTIGKEPLPPNRLIDPSICQHIAGSSPVDVVDSESGVAVVLHSMRKVLASIDNPLITRGVIPIVLFFANFISCSGIPGKVICCVQFLNSIGHANIIELMINILDELCPDRKSVV